MPSGVHCGDDQCAVVAAHGACIRRSGATHGANVRSIILQRMAALPARRDRISAGVGTGPGRRPSPLAAMCALEERQMKAAGADLAGQGVYFVAGKQFQVVDFLNARIAGRRPEG